MIKQQWTIEKYLFLVTAAILNVGKGCWTQFWKGTTQQPSKPNFEKFGSVVSEEKI
jgi:hypothetical protein